MAGPSRCDYAMQTIAMIGGGALLILAGPTAAYLALPALGVPATFAGLSLAIAVSSVTALLIGIGAGKLMFDSLERIGVPDDICIWVGLPLTIASTTIISGLAVMGALGVASVVYGIAIATLGAGAVYLPIWGGQFLYYGSKRAITYLSPIIRNFCADLCT